MSYNIYDNSNSVESLIKEFNRTQRKLRNCVKNNNTKEYQQIFKYRNDIRKQIKFKEKIKESNNARHQGNNNNDNTNNINTSKHITTRASESTGEVIGSK